MTKIIFDIKRDNGYGKNIYLKGSLNIFQNRRGDTAQKSNMFFQLGDGPIEFELEPTNGEYFWTVREAVGTPGSTQLQYERNVEIPDSDKPINFLDLPDVDPATFFQN